MNPVLARIDALALLDSALNPASARCYFGSMMGLTPVDKKTNEQRAIRHRDNPTESGSPPMQQRTGNGTGMNHHRIKATL